MDDNLVFCRDKPLICQISLRTGETSSERGFKYVIAFHVKIILTVLFICIWKRVVSTPLTINITTYHTYILLGLSILLLSWSSTRFSARNGSVQPNHRLSFGLNKRWSDYLARSAILATPLHQFRDSLQHYLVTGVGAQSVPGDCVHWRKDLIRAAQCAWCGSCSLPLLQEEDRTATSTTFQFRLQITPTGSVTHRTPTELLPQGVPY